MAIEFGCLRIEIVCNGNLLIQGWQEQCQASTDRDVHIGLSRPRAGRSRSIWLAKRRLAWTRTRIDWTSMHAIGVVTGA